jgi:hypothetical protein
MAVRRQWHLFASKSPKSRQPQPPDTPATAFPHDQDLLQTLELAGGNANLVILDACRDNPFRRATRGLSLGLARMDAPVGSIIGYATGPGQMALDGNGAHSPYTQALANALLVPGLAIEQVFKQVRRRVYEGTAGAQTPWEESSLIQDVVLGGDAALPAAVASLPAAMAAATPAAASADSSPAAAPLRDARPPASTDGQAGAAAKVAATEKNAAPADRPRRPRPMPESTAAEPARVAATAGAPAATVAVGDGPKRVRDFILRYHAAWSGSGREARARPRRLLRGHRPLLRQPARQGRCAARQVELCGPLAGPRLPGRHAQLPDQLRGRDLRGVLRGALLSARPGGEPGGVRHSAGTRHTGHTRR